jgi:lipopolysaccharide biosynthesis regulator YciM
MLGSYLIVILCFCAIAFLFFYIFKLNHNRKTGTKELYSEGLDMMINGLQRSAYNNFKKIVDLDSDNIKAYLRLGQVLREGGKVTKAIKMHKNLLIRKNITNYELIELYKNLTLDYYKIKNYRQSIIECKNILKYESKNIQTC